MGWRDRLRRHRDGSADGEPRPTDATGAVRDGGDTGTGGGPGGGTDSTPSDGPTGGRDDVTDFAPRPDGDYHCADLGLYLRFARPTVIETDTALPEPARGEFTASGRFTVQRPFARAVVYTVLEQHADASLLVRRTDTNDRSSHEVAFAFEPDPPRIT